VQLNNTFSGIDPEARISGKRFKLSHTHKHERFIPFSKSAVNLFLGFSGKRLSNLSASGSHNDWISGCYKMSVKPQ
jgi:hypothetical protein